LELNPVSPTAKGPAKTFSGDVYVNPMYRGEAPSRMIISLVRFTPGARSACTPTRSARPCTSQTASGWCRPATAR
jgi:hypothetical protein